MAGKANINRNKTNKQTKRTYPRALTFLEGTNPPRTQLLRERLQTGSGLRDLPRFTSRRLGSACGFPVLASKKWQEMSSTVPRGKSPEQMLSFWRLQKVQVGSALLMDLFPGQQASTCSTTSRENTSRPLVGSRQERGRRGGHGNYCQ